MKNTDQHYHGDERTEARLYMGKKLKNNTIFLLMVATNLIKRI